MGMIWRSTMTLLTTLAALVIIVNCVEEDLESDYRREIRPRNLDTGTHNYDQSWRAIEEQEQDSQKPQNAENFDVNSPEGAPQRRRPGRKRKRRPHKPLNEEINLKEEVPYKNEPLRHYHDVDFENFRQTTEMPRRRRKRPEVRPVRWTDDEVMIVDRPLQNNGGRRKNRLKLETFPVLSEFSNIGHLGQEKIETETETNTHQILVEQVFGHNREHRTSGIKKYHVAADVDAEEDADQISKASITADRSLSEFSMELIPKPKEEGNLTPAIVKPTTNTPETTTVTERAKSQTYDVYKLHEFENSEPEHQQPIPNKRVRLLKSKKKKDRIEQKEQDKALEKTDSQDQLTLKDILKRSNGTSLSEILQKHNLSLSDLLHGKEHAVSLLKSKDTLNSDLSAKNISTEDTKEELDIKDSSEQPPINIISNYDIQPVSTIRTTETVPIDSEPETTPATTVKTLKDNEPKVSTNRRFPMNLRKKLRIRPIQNATNVFKGQLNRDLLTFNTRKYSNFRRNITKSRQWSDIIPQMIHNSTNKENKNKTLPVKTTTEVIPEDTTISIEVANQNGTYENMHLQINADTTLDDIDMDVTESAVVEPVTESTKNFTEKRLGIVSMPRPTAISSGLRRQALNNRLKKKRIKNKNSATEPPQDDIIKHLFGMGNLVSSSEFIARTESPQIMEDDSTEPFTLDIITTERFSKTHGHIETTSTQTTTQQVIIETTTEEPAKIEIEEIFSDAEARKKLARILKERNMTLNELVALRERGSSNLHLADIFHNASREPNPAEPFLSKSLLEPISKETYPLRAILEANLHDTNGRISTVDSNINIPVVMDFRNNVNENTENIGISSLFNSFSKNITESTSTDLEDRNLTMHSDSIIKNTSQVRESRVLDKIQDDVVSWNEIFSLMGKSRNEGIEESSGSDTFKKLLIEDPEGDRLIVLEDLQHLTDLNNNIASVPKEKLDVKSNTAEKEASVPEKIPSHTKSVTVATASIAGLAMVLFLLTYATYKWRQQKSLMRKRSFCADRIPTPVFENRKGHKNNSSTRSVSPMLQTSNIYTLNTLDSHNGKESPDYMWDSLRKPFQ